MKHTRSKKDSSIENHLWMGLFILLLIYLSLFVKSEAVAAPSKQQVDTVDVYMPGVTPPQDHEEDPPRTQRESDLDTLYNDGATEEEKDSAFDRLMEPPLWDPEGS